MQNVWSKMVDYYTKGHSGKSSRVRIPNQMPHFNVPCRITSGFVNMCYYCPVFYLSSGRELITSRHVSLAERSHGQENTARKSLTIYWTRSDK